MTRKLNRGQFKSLTVLSSIIIVSTVALGLEATVHSRRMSERGTQPLKPSVVQPSIPELLLQINSKQNAASNGYLNGARAQLVRAKLDSHMLDPQETVRAEFEYGSELMNAGKTDDALR